MTALLTRLPVNEAPYPVMLFRDPISGRHVRRRIADDLAGVMLEAAAPIRKFPAYRGKRAHEGSFWFSRSASHVRFESYFELIALMVLDFGGQVRAVSSNPFWLLWPRGTTPARHAPDFFARLHDGSTLIVDVKPKARITDADRDQHCHTREVCAELGWRYHIFSEIERAVQLNVSLLAGYSHPRFAANDAISHAVHAMTRPPTQPPIALDDLISAVSDSTGEQRSAVLASTYHLMWLHHLHADLTRPLTWNTQVWR